MRSKVRCKFNITITTNSLSTKIIPDENQFRHGVIFDLYSKGYTDIEISDYLNKSNILTPTGKKYYYNLVSVTRKKLQLRDSRMTTSFYELSRLTFNQVK